MEANTNKPTLQLLMLCGMSDFKLRQKLVGLQDLDIVSRIILIRRRKFEGSKITSYSVPSIVAWNLILSEVYRALTAFWLCMRNRPDVIISFYLYYHGIIGWILGRLFDLPVVQVLIGTDLERSIRSKKMISILRSAARIAVGGSSSSNRLIASGIEKTKIFYPTSAFSVSDYPIADYAEAENDLIFVGSLVPVKRVDRLLKIVAGLKLKKQGIRLAIVGDGPLKQPLEKLAAELGIADNVIFFGSVPGKDVPLYLCKSKIFVMTSETEGLPMAMIEALSCGIPVVVPDVGDVRCVVYHNKNGLLVDASDKAGVADTLWQILYDSEYLMSLRRGAVRTRDIFKRDYSQKAVCQVWESALESIFANK